MHNLRRCESCKSEGLRLENFAVNVCQTDPVRINKNGMEISGITGHIRFKIEKHILGIAGDIQESQLDQTLGLGRAYLPVMISCDFRARSIVHRNADLRSRSSLTNIAFRKNGHRSFLQEPNCIVQPLV
jgi:hypothetical protein